MIFELLIILIDINKLLDSLSKIATILGLVFLIFAYLEFVDRRKTYNKESIVDQVKFFREDIINQWEGLVSLVSDKIPNYKFSEIKLNQKTTLSSLISYNKNEVLNQKIVTDNLDLFKSQTKLLNAIEDFSLRISLSCNQSSPYLGSLKKTFVQIVECNAYPILFHREIITDKSVYNSLLDLYYRWEKDVDKITFEAKIAAFENSLNK